MKNFFNKSLLIIASIVVFLSVSVFVVLSEREKRLEKTRAYYEALNKDWAAYKSQYQEEVDRIRRENQEAMAKTRAEYERLLQEQPALVAQHTRQVASVTQQTQTNSTVSNSSQSSTQTIRVAKPKSKPATSAS